MCQGLWLSARKARIPWSLKKPIAEQCEPRSSTSNQLEDVGRELIGICLKVKKVLGRIDKDGDGKMNFRERCANTIGIEYILS